LFSPSEDAGGSSSFNYILVVSLARLISN